MNRDVHVRFCEGVGVKFPRATLPLIHTWLDFNLAQNVGVSQRFSGFGTEPPQTGQTPSPGFAIMVSLHLGHLRGRTSTRSISLAMWTRPSVRSQLKNYLFLFRNTQ